MIKVVRNPYIEVETGTLSREPFPRKIKSKTGGKITQKAILKVCYLFLPPPERF